MDKKKFVRECYENFPEASECLSCVGWNYNKFRFTFIDEEDGKKHVVREADALRGLDLFIEAVDAGKLKGLGLTAGWKEDTGMMDAWSFDAINQMAIFGEVIYG